MYGHACGPERLTSQWHLALDMVAEAAIARLGERQTKDTKVRLDGSRHLAEAEGKRLEGGKRGERAIPRGSCALCSIPRGRALERGGQRKLLVSLVARRFFAGHSSASASLSRHSRKFPNRLLKSPVSSVASPMRFRGFPTRFPCFPRVSAIGLQVR